GRRGDHGGGARAAPGDRPAVSSGIGADRARLSPARSLPARGRHAAAPAPGPSGRGERPRARAATGVRAAARRGGPVIIESILTTLDGAGTPNFAPMGVEWGDQDIVIKPFLETTTFRNLRDTGAAVVNLTDDVMLFAQGAIATVQFPAVPATAVRGVVLEAVCSWRVWDVPSLEAPPPSAQVVLAGGSGGALARRHTAASLGGDLGGASGVWALVPGRQPGAPRGARGRDPGHPHPPAAGRADPRRARAAAGDRGQDGGPTRARG